jgi:hypothetical protein
MGNTKIYEALLARCQAERIEALATLDVYMSNPVGIGEHPQIIEESMKQLDKLANAEGKLTELKKQYGNQNKTVGEESDMDLASLARKMDDFLKIVTEGK